jgi:hypothetical protein
MTLTMPRTVRFVRERHRCTLRPLLSTLTILSVVAFAHAQPAANGQTASPQLPSVQEMIASRTDVWGDAAMRQPNGANYEFFENLLPPLRWVNTDFRHYPIVLSAPRAPQKTRLVSNGSAINPRAEKPPMWYEQGAPVAFFVGEDAEPFGEDLTRLDGPGYLDGFLPVVQLTYRQSGVAYHEEVFAPVDEKLAASGTSMVRFSLRGDASASGRIEARIDAAGTLRVDDGAICNEEGKCLLAFAGPWEWNAERNALVAKLVGEQTAELAIYTKPASAQESITRAKYEDTRKACVEAWKSFLARSVTLVTPETRVNDAWRAMLIGTYMLAVGDRLNYSAGNAYAKLYEGESGDVLRSVLLFGHLDDARVMLKPLLEFDRKATRFHVAGHKLQLLAYYYWITRDAKTVREYEPLWRPAVELILTSREKETGLLPKDNYAGDIAEQVYSLNSNANCWRGLRDVAAMLEDMGEKDEAEKVRSVAAEYRNVILDAVAKSERLDAKPPFIPIALLADEPAHDPLTATRTGSYYDLMCPYVIGSEIFGQGSKREDWLIGYLQQHGGISMGMIRTMPVQGQFKDQPGVNPLYGLRYQMALLRRDEREKAIVGFYGQLAQGMTRGTFIGGEGSRFVHGDANGRSFYLPPNSASNAAWLITLRNLLIQDWDLDEDARPDTLRLLFAAPRAWLADGSVISVDKAPTMFGPVSFDVKSRLGDGSVQVRVTPPPRELKSMLLRASVPEGWRVEGVEIDGADAKLIDANVVDLSGRTKPVVVRFKVKRS